MGTQLSNIHSYSDFLQEYQPQIRTASLLGVTLNETAEAYQSLVSYQGLVQQGPVTGSFLSEVPEITSLGVPEVCEILGLSKSAYYRAVKFDVLPEAIVEKLTSLFKIYDRGIIVFNGLKEEIIRLYCVSPKP